ncbi:MAG: PEP-CTERM sorting domain-containing protein [Fimbriimonas sp.]|nr:PEP-CTERM sorting domain-containing protein [Fimbriimonas sp.]
MKRLLALSTLALGTSLSVAQNATFTPGTASNTTTFGSPSFSASGNSIGVSGAAGAGTVGGSTVRPFVLNNVVSGVNNRFDVSVTSTFVLNGNGINPQTASSAVSGAGTATNSTTSSGASSPAATVNRFAAQSGSSFTLTAGIDGRKGTSSSTVGISGVTAPLATGSITTGSVATAGSPTDPHLSSPTLWVFHFPGDPATGNATINLSNTAASFSRALSSSTFASLHRDNVRLEVRAFLNGVQVGTTQTSAVNTTLAPNAGAGSNAMSFNSIPSLTLGVADIYGQTKQLTVVTKLIGTAYFGNSTMLGDYEIASSTFSGVTVQGVPEPASIAGLSLGLLAFARRRKNK